MSWGHGSNCVGCVLSSFPNPQIGPLLLAMEFLSSTSTWEVSFAWFARKRCNHQDAYSTILSHHSGCYFTEVEDWAGYNSPQSSYCDSLSFQANWQMHIDFSQHTFTVALGLTKIFITTLWLNFYCFPNLHVGKLCYIMCRRSGQASDTDHFELEASGFTRLWQAVPSCLGGLSSLSPVSKEWMGENAS